MPSNSQLATGAATHESNLATKPYRFSVGVVPGSRFRGLPLVDFSLEPTAFHDRSASQHGQQKSLDGWNKALKYAEGALGGSQNAEALRQDNLIVDADATTETVIMALKLSTDTVPIAEEYTNPPLMDGWNDDEVAKV
ncbi:hypothetical protein BJY52DRAFT_1243345 [Lactarius psammicola]|nr:hypothetical protein BJY52DRAFT_1243345 [Lactarius psammicola]